MRVETVYAAVGDDPPQAGLSYGLNVIDGLRCIPPNSINMVCTSPPYWSLRDYGVAKQVWGGSNPDCEHDWGTDIEGKPQTGGTDPNTSSLGVKSGGNTLTPEGVVRSNTRSHVPSRTSSFCLKCNAWYGCLGLEPTPDLFVEHIVEIGREIRRVLHPSGTFWLNLGDSYMSHAAKDYTNLGGREGERLGEEGYADTIIIGRPKVEGLKDKDLVGVPWRVALALQADGWWLRNDIIWQKSNAMPSSVDDRFSCKYEHIFLFAKEAQYFFDLDAVRVPHAHGSADDQSGKNPGDIWETATAQYKGAHFAVWPPILVERMIRAGTSEKGRCPNCFSPWKRIVECKGGGIKTEGSDENMTGDRLGSDPTQYDRLKLKGATVVTGAQRITLGWEPTCECEPLEPERCMVLDTFSGSGTTGVVAMKNGRNYLGIDLNEGYLDLAVARLRGQKAPQDDDDQDGAIFELFGG